MQPSFSPSEAKEYLCELHSFVRSCSVAQSHDSRLEQRTPCLCAEINSLDVHTGIISSLEASLMLAAMPRVHLLAGHQEEMYRLSLKTREELLGMRKSHAGPVGAGWRDGGRAS